MTQETVEAFHMSGTSHNCGDKVDCLKAIVELSVRDEKLNKAFYQYIKAK
ncbi:hypothetical protein I6E72_09615 [Pseudoalteromonas sp. NSLLW24]|nr:hypothetical protein [Pseudoalteromonas sp. NSLLW24]